MKLKSRIWLISGAALIGLIAVSAICTVCHETATG